jgi:hypothetical protein
VRLLSISLDVAMVAPLGSTETELVTGLCALLRTLADDPQRVQREMRALLMPSEFSTPPSPPVSLPAGAGLSGSCGGTYDPQAARQAENCESRVRFGCLVGQARLCLNLVRHRCVRGSNAQFYLDTARRLGADARRLWTRLQAQPEGAPQGAKAA